MSYRRPFAPGEWYHCYVRGVDKRTIFQEAKDYERFLQLLYLSNCTEPIHRSNLKFHSPTDVFAINRPSVLTGIGAFCLMQNHFHLLVKETRDKGISAFMQKLGTAYTMYFNIKYDRSGSLLAGPFRSRHVSNDRYLQRVIQYIHCNPTELYEPGWKNGKVKNIKNLEQRLSGYPYSSLHAYQNSAAEERKLLDSSIFEVERQLPLRRMLAEAHEYYTTHENGKARP